MWNCRKGRVKFATKLEHYGADPRFLRREGARGSILSTGDIQDGDSLWNFGEVVRKSGFYYMGTFRFQ